MASIKLLFTPQKSNSRLWALLTLIPVKLILLIPFMIVQYVYQYIFLALVLIGALLILVTGKYPEKLATYTVAYLRYNWRMIAYMICMTDKYPSFKLEKSDHPAEIDFTMPTSFSRTDALMTIIPVKLILLIPQFIIVSVWGIIIAFLMLAGILITLVKAKYPQNIAMIIKNYYEYYLSLTAYFACLDRYPAIRWNFHKDSMPSVNIPNVTMPELLK